MKVSPANPLVPIKLGNETIVFFNSGAARSVLTDCKGPLSGIKLM